MENKLSKLKISVSSCYVSFSSPDFLNRLFILQKTAGNFCFVFIGNERALINKFYVAFSVIFHYSFHNSLKFLRKISKEKLQVLGKLLLYFLYVFYLIIFLIFFKVFQSQKTHIKIVYKLKKVHI